MRLNRANLESTVRAAVRGGVRFVQLRDKHADTRARTEAARKLRNALQGSGVPLVINDDIDAAIAADVDGVHIGQDDIGVAEARARLGPDKILGLSCETPEQVARADPLMVDYLGLGTVFATPSKPDHKPTVGLDGLSRMARIAAVPTVAIGGLKAVHARDVMAAGCNGMAVVSAICGQPDPEAAARAISDALSASEE
jgi:thiamine-phosphate pyrophosphorylase